MTPRLKQFLESCLEILNYEADVLWAKAVRERNLNESYNKQYEEVCDLLNELREMIEKNK